MCNIFNLVVLRMKIGISITFSYHIKNALQHSYGFA